MAEVIAGFRDKETKVIYVIGDNYDGDREAELIKLGFLSAGKTESNVNLTVPQIKEKLDNAGISYEGIKLRDDLLSLLNSYS